MSNEFPFWLTTNQPDNIVTVAAQDTTEIISCGVNGNAPAELFELAYESSQSGQALIQLETNDGERDLALCKSPVHIATIFGVNARGFEPYRLPETLLVSEMRRLKITVTNLATDANVIRFAMNATRDRNLAPDPKDALAKAKETDKTRLTYPYFYTGDKGAFVMAPNETREESITIDSSYDFRLCQISGLSDGPYSLNIYDAETGESLINALGDTSYNVASTLLVGDGSYPLRFHVPRIIRAASKLIVRITNLSETANTIYLTLGGINLARQMWRAA